MIPFSFFTDIAFPATVFTIMVGMGLALTGDDFRLLGRAPRAVLVGLTAQLLLLPLLALGLAFALPVDPLVKAGLVLMAAAPGGVTSNAITLAAKADVALAVALTSLSSLLVCITLPFWSGLALDLFLAKERRMQLSPLEAGVSLALLTVLPVLTGMAARALWPRQALCVLSRFRIVAVGLILFMCLTTTSYNLHHFTDPRVVMENVGAAAALMLSAMLGAALFARLWRLEVQQRLTIVIEVGVHNIAVALLAAFTLLGDPTVARLPLAYGLLMIVMPWFFVAAARRHRTSGKENAP